MNKKIKVIELLNIVASGKDIPKKIKVYLRKDGEQIPDYYIFNDHGFYENCKEESFVEDWLNNTMKLNEEVEILEDEEEIDIQNIEELQTFSDSAVYDYNDIDRNRKVLNMLVKAVKKLDKNKVDYIQPYKED